MSQVPVYFALALPLVGAFAMFALGVVVIFRASRVLNLAHGAMAMVPPYFLFELSRWGVPLTVALPLAVASGAAIGVGVERVFVRALRRQGATGQTVGTVAALGLLVAVATKIWGTTPRTAVALFPEGGLDVGASLLSWGHLGLVAAAIATSGGTFILFRYTEMGLAMRLAADNRRAAALMGIDPDATTMVAWAFGGALAALAGILLAGVTTLHPINLALLVLPAFVAALVGGMETLLGALVGAAIVGLTQGMVPAIALVPGLKPLASQVGAPQLVLTVLAFVVMVLRGRRFAGSDIRADLEVSSQSVDAEIVARDGRPGLRTVGGLLGFPLLLVLPFVAPFSFVGTANNALIILLVAVSLVLLTGWVGQISLAQATFVGIGAFATALLTRVTGVGFPASLPLTALATGGVAAILGAVALRVRGLYLAVATLIFVWMSTEYLFSASWLVGSGGSASLQRQTVGVEGTIPFFDFTERRTFYFVALATVALAVWGLANVRDSKTGRAFFAVHGSEVAAASLGINVTRYKLLAFAASGVIAGAAGNLLIVNQGTAVPGQFGFVRSLFFLSVAVVGGLTSLGGAAAAALLFALLDELFFRLPALAGWLEVVSAGLLAVVLLARPGGLASVATFVREPRGSVLRRRPGSRLTRIRGAFETATRILGAPLRMTRRAPRSREPLPEFPSSKSHIRFRLAEKEHTFVMGAGGRPVLSVDGLVVRFGGLTAVDDVSLRVVEGDIVGLIGPNGAGKTTVFNAISGLNEPAAGTIALFGKEVTEYPVHRRAELGLARTFQVIQLFPRLTVFDNLLVATHLWNGSGLFSSLAVTRRSLEAEASARVRVAEVVDLLDLTAVARRQVAGLPFGVLRQVELARALVTGARFVMLDEPASGLDSGETKRMTEFLRFVRTEMGVSLLLIEHDVAMVTAVSDYIYVLSRGRLLAEGGPADVQRDEGVISAYFGRPDPAEVPV